MSSRVLNPQRFDLKEFSDILKRTAVLKIMLDQVPRNHPEHDDVVWAYRLQETLTDVVVKLTKRYALSQQQLNRLRNQA